MADPDNQQSEEQLSSDERIVAKFKSIRDLAPHDANEAEPMWDDAKGIRQLAKDIRSLLSADEDSAELEDLEHQNVGELFEVTILHTAKEMANLPAGPASHGQWRSACRRIIHATRKAEELIQPDLPAVEIAPSQSDVFTYPTTAKSHPQAVLQDDSRAESGTQGQAEASMIPEQIFGGDIENERQRLELQLLELQALNVSTNHRDVAATLDALGRVFLQYGDLQAAKQHLQESLQIYRSLHGDRDHPDVAAALVTLGQVCHHSGDLQAAKQHLQESLQMNRSLHGDRDHRDVAVALAALGQVCHHSGDLQAAKQHLQESLQMNRSLHGT